VVSLIEMGRPEQAVEFATEELQVGQLLTDRVVDAVGDPIVAALLLGKSAEAAERGIDLDIQGELAGGDLPARDLVTLLGNLLDNAFDAVAGHDERRVEVRLTAADGSTTVVVGDSGDGLTGTDATQALERGWTTKATGATGRGVGLALVNQVARRHGGGVRIGTSALGGAELTVTLRVDVGSEGR
jgi:sensor histidine kinase regulating citrate/malate metabolism